MPGLEKRRVWTRRMKTRNRNKNLACKFELARQEEIEGSKRVSNPDVFAQFRAPQIDVRLSISFQKTKMIQLVYSDVILEYILGENFGFYLIF